MKHPWMPIWGCVEPLPRPVVEKILDTFGGVQTVVGLGLPLIVVNQLFEAHTLRRRGQPLAAERGETR
jgi:hypothetical protein